MLEKDKDLPQRESGIKLTSDQVSQDDSSGISLGSQSLTDNDVALERERLTSKPDISSPKTEERVTSNSNITQFADFARNQSGFGSGVVKDRIRRKQPRRKAA